MKKLSPIERSERAKYVRSFRKTGIKEPSSQRLAWIMLNLLEALTGKKRQTIKNIFTKHKKSLSSYQDVADYIQQILSPTIVYGKHIELADIELPYNTEPLPPNKGGSF